MCKYVGAFALVLAMLLGGCAREKKITREELRSNIIELTSTAQEMTLFAGYVRERRPSDTFARMHSSYLQENLQSLAKDLNNEPDNGIEQQFQQCRAQLQALARLAGRFASSPDSAKDESFRSQLDDVLRQRSGGNSRDSIDGADALGAAVISEGRSRAKKRPSPPAGRLDWSPSRDKAARIPDRHAAATGQDRGEPNRDL